jgi:hypothetical protein
MAGIEQRAPAEKSRQSVRQTLFVEGSKSSIDPQVLKTFFSEQGINIRVEPLAHSSNLRTVARALYPYHPDYYFLIDRDHHSDEFVESCWNNFPDENTHNLLFV